MTFPKYGSPGPRYLDGTNRCPVLCALRRQPAMDVDFEDVGFEWSGRFRGEQVR